MSEVKVNKISPRTNCGTVTVGDSGDSVSVSAGVPVTVNNNLTVSGDLKSAALKAVDGGSIISQCGTNITLGASGDTINLAAGATQTGFGRTGTVDWDTTAKTASFTAVSGNGYFVNTTSGAITVTLPATPSAGDIVSVADYAGTAGTNNITIARNGSNINGSAADLTISINTSAITLVYVDGTQGWKGTQTSNLNDIELQPEYITATGGTITTCGDYKIHTFTGPGTFCVSSVGNPAGSDTVDYLVVAGGGGAGASGTSDAAGSGGAGGYRESSGTASGSYTVSPLGACVSALPVTATPYPITVGGGGSGSPSVGSKGSNGASSTFSSRTSSGGGGGGSGYGYTPVDNYGGPGGSGGGGGHPSVPGGTGNTPPVSPPQGITGATGPGGQGGSAIAPNGPGGGATSSINASPVKRASGGGAGGSGSYPAGAANTGNGGGAVFNGSGAAGGSGIVIIRYKYQ